MASKKQIEANRRNGKNGGPKTPAGRAAVRHNALKHGLSAQHPVIPILEDQTVFDEYLAQLHLDLQPQGLMEQMLVNQIADAYWRRQRIVQMETGLFASNHLSISKHLEKTYTGLTTGETLHLSSENDAEHSDMLGRYYRYDARFERSFFRAWKELKVLQSARQPQSKEAATKEPIKFAKQTEIKQPQPSPTPNPSPEPPEKGENDPSIM